MAKKDRKQAQSKSPDARHNTRGKSGATRPKRPDRDKLQGNFPTQDDILAYITQYPNKANKRDIARAFGITGDKRKELRTLLRDLEEAGHIDRSRKTFTPKGAMPTITVLSIEEENSDGDLIAYPVKWDGPGERPKVLINARTAKVAVGLGDRVLAHIDPSDDPDFAHIARPMRILEKQRKTLIGIFRLENNVGRIVPVSRKGTEFDVRPGDFGDAQEGDLVTLDVIKAGRGLYNIARVTAVIGNPESEKAVSLIALHNLEIPYVFPNRVLAESEAVTEVTMEGREDWRDLPIITIDPADAKDHDDAVYAEADSDAKNPDGHILYVAIADVAAYVTPRSALDNEAFLRGNSVYFPDRVVPMLPERISNNLCSLIDGVDRPAMGLRMVFDKNGQKQNHSFHRVMIRSAAKLSYQQAQDAADGNPDDIAAPLLETVIKPLWACYKALAKARDNRGPLNLNLPERRVRLNGKGLVERVYIPERLEAHRLIEECMVLSNVCAAETLEQHNTPLLYRTHDAPSVQKLEGLREFLKSVEINLTSGNTLKPQQFNGILKLAEESENTHLINEMILRSQAQAEYTPENYGHFGLNLRRYAHFTSPIRRYADLIVHRALIRALGLSNDGDDALQDSEISRLGTIAEQICLTERRAMAAERETIDRLMAYYLVDKIGAEFQGRIAGVIKSGLFVRLDETGADGFIPISTLMRDYYYHDEGQAALIGEKTGERFRMGDVVTVKLIEAAPVAGALRFELLSEGTYVEIDPKARPRRPMRNGSNYRSGGKSRKRK